MVSVIRQTSMPSMPSMVPAVAAAAPWPRPAATVVHGAPAPEQRRVTSSTAAVQTTPSLQGGASIGLPVSSGSMHLSSQLSTTSMRPTPAGASTVQRPGSASSIGTSSGVRQASHVERQQSGAGLQQRTVSFLPEPAANGEQVVRLLSAERTHTALPTAAAGRVSSPTRLVSAPSTAGTTVGGVVIQTSALQGVMQSRMQSSTPPVPLGISPLHLGDSALHSHRGDVGLHSHRGDAVLASHRGDVPPHSYRSDSALHGYRADCLHGHGGNILWVNGVGNTGALQQIRDNVTLAAHATNLMSPRKRIESPVRNSFVNLDQPTARASSGSPRRTASTGRMKIFNSDKAPERAQRLYEDALARRERAREKKQEKERQQKQALEEGQRDFVTRQRDRQRFYRFRDKRTHEEREEALLRRRAERVRELKLEQKEKEKDKYAECTFQPKFFTRGRSHRHVESDVRSSSCGAIVGHADQNDDVRLHDSASHRFVTDTPRNHLRPSFDEDVVDEGGNTADEHDLADLRRYDDQLQALPETPPLDITLSSAASKANGACVSTSET